MARKRGGFGRFMGALTGTPYEKMLKQVAKLETDHAEDDKKLARKLGDLADEVLAAYEEEEIDAEEHDLLMEAIEDADPDGRTFDRFEDDGDAFYDEDMPDAPDIKMGRRKNLGYARDDMTDPGNGTGVQLVDFRRKAGSNGHQLGGIRHHFSLQIELRELGLYGGGEWHSLAIFPQSTGPSNGHGSQFFWCDFAHNKFVR